MCEVYKMPVGTPTETSAQVTCFMKLGTDVCH